jgi:hypothetical protein
MVWLPAGGLGTRRPYVTGGVGAEVLVGAFVGVGSAASSGAGSLTVTEQIISLVGVGSNSSSGEATPTIKVLLGGVGSSSSIGGGAVDVIVILPSVGASAGSGAGTLTAQLALSGVGAAATIGQGFFGPKVLISGIGSSSGFGVGDFEYWFYRVINRQRRTDPAPNNRSTTRPPARTPSGELERTATAPGWDRSPKHQRQLVTIGGPEFSPREEDEDEEGWH